jgi:hypothetical protein
MLPSERRYPRECIDIIGELRVFFEFRIVRDSPEAMLVEETWQWAIGLQIYNRLIVRL